MPRDGSGNYTLPAGNPVVTGTTIDSSWANDTMDDLATEMQDSLSRSGKGGMLTAFRFADGTVGAPGQSWSSETSSGMYRAGTNDVRYSIAGVDRMQIRANATDPVRIWDSGGAAWKLVLSEGSDVTITGDWVFPSDTVIDGITASNLVDKSAAETITGTWAFGATSTFDGTQASNLLDKTAAESVSGLWLFTNSSTQLDGILLSSLLDKTANETVTGSFTLDGVVTTSDYGTGGRVKDGTDVSRPIGFNVAPVYEMDSNDNFDLAHNGMVWHKDGAGTVSYTCVNDSTIPQGAMYIIANEQTGGSVTIADGSITLRWFDGGGSAPSTGDRTLATGGVATVYKYSDAEFWIWGTGIS